jgi:hypothetical protein
MSEAKIVSFTSEPEAGVTLSPYPLCSSRFTHKENKSFQTDLQKHTNKNHALRSNSKYHYHLKQDKFYGDKKLKLCGQCTTPSNLSKELKQLNKFAKKSLTNSSSPETNRGDEEEATASFYLNKIDDDEKIEFFSLDLTSEPANGVSQLPIINLPNDLFKFTQLTRLHLDGNSIKQIPDLLGEKLVNLEVLTLSNNNLKQLPQTLKNLDKLYSMHLANNRFEQFPEILCNFNSLKYLDLTSNRLAKLSSNINKLQRLESLILFDNLIKELPDSLFKLERLTCLWLGQNSLSKLSKKILDLKNLDWIGHNTTLVSSSIGGNPLKDPPYYICTRGIEAIREYYEDKEKK